MNKFVVDSISILIEEKDETVDFNVEILAFLLYHIQRTMFY
jgi:hypothetical protein